MYWVSFCVDNDVSVASFKRRKEAYSFYISLCNLIRVCSVPIKVKFYSNTEFEELCKS